MRNRTYPSIYSYSDYRKFIRDYLDSFKTSRFSGVSLVKLSKDAGFRSASSLRMVLSGHRNLSPAATERLISALTLSNEERKFLRALIQFNQAKSIDQKVACIQDLTRFRRYREYHQDKVNRFYRILDWHTQLIRAATALPGFSRYEDPIVRTLFPTITSREIDKVLSSDDARDRFVEFSQVAAFVDADDEISMIARQKVTKTMHEIGLKAIDEVAIEQRETRSLTIKISEPYLKEIRRLADEFQTRVQQLADNGGTADRIYQLNLNLFPLTPVVAQNQDPDADADVEEETEAPMEREAA